MKDVSNKKFAFIILAVVGFIIACAITCNAQDSLVSVKTGVYTYIPTSDTTADSLTLPSFLEIEPKSIIGTTSLAHFLTVKQVCGGDFQTFAILQIRLLDSIGVTLFAKNYTLDGSRYKYASSNCLFRFAYVYWVILQLPEFGINKKK